MEKEFIHYEQALALKELGFDEPCFRCKVIGQEHLDYTPTDYDDFPEQKEKEVLIPTFSQAFRWFRENKKLISTLAHSYGNSWSYEIVEFYTQESIAGVIEGIWFNSYEEAELELLKKLIEIVNK